uniref:Uncharacterized protein n=1 Tax=Cacopsylla melanoneura TaxID=428564 RepID=A0A8D8SNB7_9HEMI
MCTFMTLQSTVCLVSLGFITSDAGSWSSFVSVSCSRISFLLPRVFFPAAGGIVSSLLSYGLKSLMECRNPLFSTSSVSAFFTGSTSSNNSFLTRGFRPLRFFTSSWTVSSLASSSTTLASSVLSTRSSVTLTFSSSVVLVSSMFVISWIGTFRGRPIFFLTFPTSSTSGSCGSGTTGSCGCSGDGGCGSASANGSATGLLFFAFLLLPPFSSFVISSFPVSFLSCSIFLFK